jgi:hypothetical protein
MYKLAEMELQDTMDAATDSAAVALAQNLRNRQSLIDSELMTAHSLFYFHLLDLQPLKASVIN